MAEMRELLLEVAEKNLYLYGYIYQKNLRSKSLEEEMLKQIKEELLSTFSIIDQRGLIQNSLPGTFVAAFKKVKKYEKMTPNTAQVAELLVTLLDYAYDNYAIHLGTPDTMFDSTLAVATTRLYEIVAHQLPPDDREKYSPAVNKFLKILHEKSGHLKNIAKMPKAVPAQNQNL